jgi:hypothetical protein
VSGKRQVKRSLRESDLGPSKYDYDSAMAAGLSPSKTGHWPSRDPKTGLILKHSTHPTFKKTVKGEKKAGYKMYRKNGRYYSSKTGKP